MKELYEVFRVQEGIPLFLEDHLKRLFKGVYKSGFTICKTKEELENEIKNYLSLKNISEGNVRLSFFINPETNKSKNFEIRFYQPEYPVSELYQKGIECTLLHSERINPETKIAHTQLRKEADEILNQKRVFEALLINRNGQITEGSRSNAFFIKNNILITAPDHMVLPGIIRLKTVTIAAKQKIQVKYRCLDAHSELPLVEAAFITGTSPRIMPVKKIDRYNLKPNHPVILQLMADLEKMVNQYIKNAKL